MRVAQDVLFDVTGQFLYLDCPEGRPSSVTSVDIFAWDASDDADSEWVATPAIETGPSTTIDAASGYGLADARLLYVAATTSAAIGRTYLVTSADGAKEWFTVAEIDSGNYLMAQHPLHNAYATSDTVQSTRITATVDSTWVADSANLRDDAGPNPHFRALWVYTVAGVKYVADTYFNLVRYAGKHDVRPQDVDAFGVNWLDSLPSDHRASQGRSLIDNAYKAVKLALHAVWTDDAMVANAEIIDELTRYKTLELGEFAKILAGSGDTTAYQVARDEYQRNFDALSRITNKTPIRDSTGAAQERPALGLTVR